jgi:hypothetical protein
MQAAIASPLAAWADFYVIVGSAGAALTGLQFVVMALINESTADRGSETISAFGTPTVVHFCAVLLTAAMLSMPWGGLAAAGNLTMAIGILGVVYAVIVTNRARKQTRYAPVLEDWLWHSVLPLVAYGTMAAAGGKMRGGAGDWLFIVGAMLLLLLSIGIHNAWDTVTYIALEFLPKAAPDTAATPAESPGPR